LFNSCCTSRHFAIYCDKDRKDTARRAHSVSIRDPRLEGHLEKLLSITVKPPLLVLVLKLLKLIRLPSLGIARCCGPKAPLRLQDLFPVGLKWPFGLGRGPFVKFFCGRGCLDGLVYVYIL
jgi:hypothetical protein